VQDRGQDRWLPDGQDAGMHGGMHGGMRDDN